MSKIVDLLLAGTFATVIIVAAGCASKEEAAKPSEEAAKSPEAEKMPGGAKLEEGAKSPDTPVPEKK